MKKLEWQSMESAPRDGSQFRGRCPYIKRWLCGGRPDIRLRVRTTWWRDGSWCYWRKPMKADRWTPHEWAPLPAIREKVVDGGSGQGEDGAHE